MKCSEYGSKCIKVQIDSTAERVTFECPDCCNVFEKAVSPKARKPAAHCRECDIIASADCGHR